MAFVNLVKGIKYIYYSLFQHSWPRFESGIDVSVVCTYLWRKLCTHWVLRNALFHRVCSRELAASLPQGGECIRAIESSVSGMPGRGKGVNSTAKTIIYNVCKYFERESTKSKYRGPPKLTHKTAEAASERYDELCRRSKH